MIDAWQKVRGEVSLIITRSLLDLPARGNIQSIRSMVLHERSAGSGPPPRQVDIELPCSVSLPLRRTPARSSQGDEATRTLPSNHNHHTNFESRPPVPSRR